ncbi:MAG: hypothetical protein K2W85_02855 [Phycisphaerales bacterium]|nr:hypothetical protein [Phycisphaerales bacterium]
MVRHTVLGSSAITASAAAAVMALAAPAMAQFRVELRTIERTGQTVADANDNVLDFAVQARVTNDATLMFGGVNLRVQMPGEAQGRGTLARGIISNSDGTYSNALGISAPGTVSGLAAQYRYLFSLNSGFNGGINSSVGPELQDPTMQDIVGIAPYSAGDALTGVPELFTFDPNTGDPIGPPGGMVPAAIGNQYFGARGNWVDIYRFRYTVTDLAERTVQVNPWAGTTISTFSQLALADSVWGAQITANQRTADNLALIGTTFDVVPAPTSVGVLAMLAMGASRRRR